MINRGSLGYIDGRRRVWSLGVRIGGLGRVGDTNVEVFQAPNPGP